MCDPENRVYCLLLMLCTYYDNGTIELTGSMQNLRVIHFDQKFFFKLLFEYFEVYVGQFNENGIHNIDY